MSESPETSTGLWEQVRSQLAAWQSRSEVRQVNSAMVAEKLARRAQAFRERTHQPRASGPVVPVMCFSANRVRYGIPLEFVVEVVSLNSVSLVPGGPGFLQGVVHFRGMILSLLNLSRLFGTPETGIADIHFYIVVQGAGHRVAIAAGDVEDLLDVPIEDIKPAPEWSGQTPQNWIRGVFQEDRLILQFDAILEDDSMKNWRSRVSGPS